MAVGIWPHDGVDTAADRARHLTPVVSSGMHALQQGTAPSPWHPRFTSVSTTSKVFCKKPCCRAGSHRGTIAACAYWLLQKGVPGIPRGWRPHLIQSNWSFVGRQDTKVLSVWRSADVGSVNGRPAHIDGRWVRYRNIMKSLALL